MSIWFTIFAMIWTFIICVGCTLLGARIMWAKQAKVDPAEGLPIPNWRSLFTAGDSKKDEEPMRFFD